jgi:hypothetical protein
MVDGHNAGSQGMHVLVVFKNIILPRGAIPINFRRGNLEFEEEDSGTCPPDVLGPLGT